MSIPVSPYLDIPGVRLGSPAVLAVSLPPNLKSCESCSVTKVLHGLMQ